MTIDQWIAGAPGRAMNPDQAYGLQCKDVIDDYCIALFGNWVNTIRPGNAKVCFDNSNPDFFEKIRNNPNDPNQVPPRGAIMVWDGNMGGGVGHIAVIERATPDGFDVIEQDGFKQIPAYRNHYRTYKYVIGWLVPKVIGGNVPTSETAEQVEQRLLHGPGGVDEWIVKHYEVSQQLARVQDELGMAATARDDALAKLATQIKTVSLLTEQVGKLQNDVKALKESQLNLDVLTLGDLLKAVVDKILRIK